MFKSISQLEFLKKFQSSEDCYQYLGNYKWGNGSSARCAAIQLITRAGHGTTGVAANAYMLKVSRHIGYMT